MAFFAHVWFRLVVVASRRPEYDAAFMFWNTHQVYCPFFVYIMLPEIAVAIRTCHCLSGTKIPSGRCQGKADIVTVLVVCSLERGIMIDGLSVLVSPGFELP